MKIDSHIKLQSYLNFNNDRFIFSSNTTDKWYDKNQACDKW